MLINTSPALLTVRIPAAFTVLTSAKLKSSTLIVTRAIIGVAIVAATRKPTTTTVAVAITGMVTRLNPNDITIDSITIALITILSITRNNVAHVFDQAYRISSLPTAGVSTVADHDVSLVHVAGATAAMLLERLYPSLHLLVGRSP